MKTRSLGIDHMPRGVVFFQSHDIDEDVGIKFKNLTSVFVGLHKKIVKL